MGAMKGALLLLATAAVVSAIPHRLRANIHEASLNAVDDEVAPEKVPLRLTFQAIVNSSQGDESSTHSSHVAADRHRLAIALSSGTGPNSDGVVLDALNNRRYSKERFFDETVCYTFDMQPAPKQTSEEDKRNLGAQLYFAALGQFFGVPLEFYEAVDEYHGKQVTHRGWCHLWRGHQQAEIEGNTFPPPGLRLASQLFDSSYTKRIQAAMQKFSAKSRPSGKADDVPQPTMRFYRNVSFCVTPDGELMETAIEEKLIAVPKNESLGYETLYANTQQASAEYKHGSTPDASVFDGARGAVNGRCVDLTQGRVGASELKSSVNDAGRIARINTEAGGHWRAAPYDVWKNSKVEEIVPSLGTEIGPLSLPLRSMARSGPLSQSGAFGSAEEELPKDFDPRKKWPLCKSIATIRNQGMCGSCWAFSAVASLEDRFCISAVESSKVSMLSKGKTSSNISTGFFSDFELSPGHLVDCDNGDGGCQGGRLDTVWWYLRDNGVPLEKCRPYRYCPFPGHRTCANITDQTNQSQSEPDMSAMSVTEEDRSGFCLGTCAADQPMHFFRATSAYAVSKPGDVQSMQRDLIAHGPIQVAFFVFSDFENYQEGVYFRTPSAYGPMGGHAVRLLGWGTNNTQDYWLLANSWSPEWGEGGNFRIRRGTNECGIETTPASGLVPQGQSVVSMMLSQKTL